MSAKLWSNVQIAVQSALGAAGVISAITKANPAVVSDTAHGLLDGEYVVLQIQGMFELNNRVCRVANKTNDTYELEGVDSSAYNTFSSGTAEKITFGTTLSGITDVNVAGGDFEDIDTTTIHDTTKSSIPGAASAINITMSAMWDPADAGLIALKAASDARVQRAVRVTFADSTKWLFNGYVGCTNAPTGAGQQLVKTPLTMKVNGRTTTYAT